MVSVHIAFYVAAGVEGDMIENFLHIPGWNFRSSVEIFAEVPIWLLGCCYHAEKDSSE